MMSNTPPLTLRQSQIISWLKDEEALSIKELVQRLEVSSMTIHRDLDRLADQGLVQKVRGGARLAVPEPPAGAATTAVSETCLMCHMPVRSRTQFVLHTAGGPPRTACCAHCGLLYLGQLAEQEAVPSALARDFLYGRMVNVQSAFFVVQSAVEVCCVPSTLCFATAEDATRFQQGFGGEVLTYAEAIAFLEQRHQGCHSCASSVTTNTTNK